MRSLGGGSPSGNDDKRPRATSKSVWLPLVPLALIAAISHNRPLSFLQSPYTSLSAYDDSDEVAELSAANVRNLSVACHVADSNVQKKLLQEFEDFKAKTVDAWMEHEVCRPLAWRTIIFCCVTASVIICLFLNHSDCLI